MSHHRLGNTPSRLIATGGAIPLERQGAVFPSHALLQATEGWGESSVEEWSMDWNASTTDRATARVIAQKGAAASHDELAHPSRSAGERDSGSA